MRQIITQDSWSAGSRGNSSRRFGASGSLGRMDASPTRGETDSSFEVSHTSGSSYAHGSKPQIGTGDSNRNSNNNSNRGTSFVPADHSDRIEPGFVSTHETSWDALASDSLAASNPVARTVVTPSPPSRNRMPGRSSSFLRKHRQQQQQQQQQQQRQYQQHEQHHPYQQHEQQHQPQPQQQPPHRPESATPSEEDPPRSGSKIARLASMFSSRAEPVVVPLRAASPVDRSEHSSPSPSSPPGSESSAGYVVWPGTQDREGVTVLEESSYDESDASVGAAREPARDFAGSDRDKVHRLAGERNPSAASNGRIVMEPLHDDALSDLSAGYSRTSSAYFSPGEVQAIRKGNTEQLVANQNRNRLAATVMRRCLSSSSSSVARRHPQQRQQHQHQNQHQLQPLTEEALAMKNHLSPPTRSFVTTGYRGLLDKTRDVPNLMDETASDTTSAVSAATSRQSMPQQPRSSPYDKHLRERQQHQQQHKRVDTIDEYGTTEDVFATEENVGGYDAGGANRSSNASFPEDGDHEGLLGVRSRDSVEKLNLALLGGGLTTIQTTSDDFTNRKTASDFDETLSNSDCDQNGFVKIPALNEMLSAGRNHHDSALSCQSLRFASEARSIRRNHQDRSGLFSDPHGPAPARHGAADFDGNFGRFYIGPEQMQILVKKFRRMSLARCKRLDYEELEREEDATKAFALSEMRSRIMETDIERGLERMGGTTVVDDIVLTSFYRAALRVRDAVIVAKAWRDGATPHDVVTTSKLTRRDERSYYIARYGASAGGAARYTWEEVCWLDDSELSRYRCHSIGPRHLKGVEMFTIGDCQSILLKLSNERCKELRAELNRATAIQIEAEAAMKEEGETFDGMMTDAEMTYLTSMEEVKSISQKLVLAEKSFGLVRDRIEKLVAKYEALLVHFENETDSVAPSSVFSYESSCYSEDYSFAAAQKREDELLARRARRAELRAELEARESRMAPGDSQSVVLEQERVLDGLKARISDLRSESSAAFTDRDRSVVLARAIRRGPPAAGSGDASGKGTGRSKIDDIKQRFRDRSAAKSQVGSGSASGGGPNQPSAPGGRSGSSGNRTDANHFQRTVGEEMFQHLDFYERSLKAVEGHRYH